VIVMKTTQREKGRTLTPGRRAAARYVAIGLRPDMLAAFTDHLEEEGALLLRVEHDDEGSAQVIFQLAAGDPGPWLPMLTRQWGCGLAPAPR